MDMFTSVLSRAGSNRVLDETQGVGHLIHKRITASKLLRDFIQRERDFIQGQLHVARECNLKRIQFLDEMSESNGERDKYITKIAQMYKREATKLQSIGYQVLPFHNTIPGENCKNERMDKNRIGFDFDGVIHKDNGIRHGVRIRPNYPIIEIMNHMIAKGKDLYIVTHNPAVEAISRIVRDLTEKTIPVYHAQGNKSEIIIKERISEFYDDTEQVLEEIYQHVVKKPTFAHFKLFKVYADGKMHLYPKIPELCEQYDISDDDAGDPLMEWYSYTTEGGKNVSMSLDKWWDAAKYNELDKIRAMQKVSLGTFRAKYESDEKSDMDRDYVYAPGKLKHLTAHCARAVHSVLIGTRAKVRFLPKSNVVYITTTDKSDYDSLANAASRILAGSKCSEVYVNISGRRIKFQPKKKLRLIRSSVSVDDPASFNMLISSPALPSWIDVIPPIRGSG
jgi:hypothetical protein